MKNSWLVHRDRQPEWMDDPHLDPLLHCRALSGLARVNRWSTAAGQIWKTIAGEFDPTGVRPLRVLDLASGGGDTALRLALRANREGRKLEIVGCDISQTAIDFANRTARQAGADNLQFQRRDVLNEPLPENFDVVMSSLFLHHLDFSEGVRLMHRMAAAASRLAIVDDLLRSPLHYGLAWFGCRLLTRSPVVRQDGPLSVRAALRMEEAIEMAARAGWENATIRRHWPFRFLLTCRRL